MIVDGKRELAYAVVIDAIEPIEGKDRVEAAVVGGWRVMVKKSEFQPGDVAVYFEIDSLVDGNNPAFAFLAQKKYKIKTQKYKAGEGHFFSQGLIMSFADLGIEPVEVGTPLTESLKVKYYVEEDNKRKSAKGDPNEKYRAMSSRHAKLARTKWWKWFYRRVWGKKLLFVLFGKKKDNAKWPSHIAKKTDVERIQNMMYVFDTGKEYVASEKVDGSSMTVAIEKGRFGKTKQYICSRNVVFQKPDDKCFYDKNIYYEMYEKYGLGEKIECMFKDLNLPNLALQMEVYGNGVQKRDYSMTDGERKIAVFHIVSNCVKMPMDKVVELCEKYDLPHVPIVSESYYLPKTIDELREFVESTPSAIDGLEKEGIVFYDKESGLEYFKFVSPNFLMKYHG